VKRVLYVGLLVVVVSFVLTWFALLRPPAEWRGLHAGMSLEQVYDVVPRSDLIETISAALAIKKGTIITWRLEVVFGLDNRVESVERKAWTNWPDKWTVRTIVEK
jgi:hypothetical protein